VCAIDAGPTTDASSDVSAPPPDAGPCTDTPSTFIASTTTVATPHIARTAKGYALAWVDSVGAIHAAIVDASGNVISPDRMIAQGGSTVKLDAIATDTNDQNYFVVYDLNGTLYGTSAPTPGGGAYATPIVGTTGPVDGAFWEATQSVWVTG